MKVTKEYLKKLIKESIQSLNEEKDAFYLVTDEGYEGLGEYLALSIEEAKEIADHLDIKSREGETDVKIYKVFYKNEIPRYEIQKPQK